MNKELTKFYEQKASELRISVSRLRQKSRGFVAAEVGTFLVAIGFVVFYTLSSNASWLLLFAALSVVLYLYIRHLDVKNDRLIRADEALLMVYEQELDYQKGDFGGFDAGERYVNPQHAYTYDLDVFGRGSLFQRLNRTVSTGGSNQLAACLSMEWGNEKGENSVERIIQRRESIKELSRNEAFLSRFKSFGTKEKINTESVIRAFDSLQTLSVSSLFSARWFRFLCYADLLGFYLSMVFSALDMAPGLLPVWWGMFNFMLAMLSSHKYISRINELITKVHHQVSGYLQVMRLINQTDFKASELQELKQKLSGGEESLEELDRILQKIDNRSNEIGVFLFNSFSLIDITIVRLFSCWQRNYHQFTDQWIATLNLFDALVSMGNFRLNEHRAVDAEVCDEEKVVYEAEGLYHPFLGEKAVANDFRIDNHEYYIITGANMAGKSTFLRSLGINYLLAMNGLPVFAFRLKISVFHLFTSMRTTDDLTHGISYFNAELQRLKQLLGALRQDVPSLIILDEILKGTNSLDKLNGSRLFLDHISGLNVTGVIATHDLELSKMEDEKPQLFHNYCFEIELGTSITYSYKITKGVARNQNATYLLKEIL